MKRVLILGSGMMGKTIARDLCKDFKVTAVDKNIDSLKNLVEFCDNEIEDSLFFNILNKKEDSIKLIKGFDIIVGTLPGSIGYKVAGLVLEAGKDYVDISFAPEDLRTLNNLAIQNGARCIIDFGVAPGLSHLVFGHCESIYKRIEEYFIYVGGLVPNSKSVWNYKTPFSPADVIEEYIRPARFIRNGKVQTLPALSELVEIDISGTGIAKLEAFLTDGVRTLLDKKGVDSIIEKTIRPRGYCDKIKLLMDSGFFDLEKIDGIVPKEITEKILLNKWKMKDEDRDMTVMKLHVIAEDYLNNLENRTYYLIDMHDGKNTSMARTTGFMCAAGVRLIAHGLWSDVGVFAPEKIGMKKECFEFIIEELSERGVHLTR